MTVGVGVEDRARGGDDGVGDEGGEVRRVDRTVEPRRRRKPMLFFTD